MKCYSFSDDYGQEITFITIYYTGRQIKQICSEYGFCPTRHKHSCHKLRQHTEVCRDKDESRSQQLCQEFLCYTLWKKQNKITTMTARTQPKNLRHKRVKTVIHQHGVLTCTHMRCHTNTKFRTHKGFTRGLYLHKDYQPANGYCTQHQPMKPHKKRKQKQSTTETSRYSVQMQQLIDHVADCRWMNRLMENERATHVVGQTETRIRDVGWLCTPCVYDPTFVTHLVHFQRTIGPAREQVTKRTEVDLRHTGTGVTEKWRSFGMFSSEGIHQVVNGKSPHLEIPKQQRKTTNW